MDLLLVTSWLSHQLPLLPLLFQAAFPLVRLTQLVLALALNQLLRS
ncbi:hypothetical protein COO91_08552 [Nostoc flagelliforme CCNUN1]|uniref:Uncharacterized protein n=1 Tax=Nostoc flagelliforme CCNUN1 TaxID=2038116 RepID=A0A2K8T3Z8_9NOSO|nr:hypothetical protein COO91_08552 [Nostoc flagelliforme CCNUN1]